MVETALARELIDDRDLAATLAPGIRGTGLEPSELLMLATGLGADFTTLILARSHLRAFAHKARSVLQRQNPKTRLDLEYRRGGRTVRLSIQADDPLEIADAVEDLMKTIE